MDISWIGLLVLLLCTCSVDSNRLLHKSPRRQIKKVLWIAGFFNLSRGDGVLSNGSGFEAAGIIPAVKLAIKHINHHPGILHGYKLKVKITDTQVRSPQNHFWLILRKLLMALLLSHIMIAMQL